MLAIRSSRWRLKFWCAVQWVLLGPAELIRYQILISNAIQFWVEKKRKEAYDAERRVQKDG